jgi:predicted RNA-binding Zn-ribbon protein involved in translation (DUF1610 family)
MGIMAIHIEPSWFVRNARVYRAWCLVTVCRDCGLRAKYEDAHPVDPCPNCGGEMVKSVGKWSTTVKPLLFGWIRREQGKWVLKDEEVK